MELTDRYPHETDQRVGFVLDSGWRDQEKRLRFYAFYRAELHEQS